MLDLATLEQKYFIKVARIKKLPNGKYRVVSEKGKNLGESNSLKGAKKRLQQVEFFKHKDLNHIEEKQEIDLSKLEANSYSAIVRELNKNATKEQVIEFLSLYKHNFDKSFKAKLQKPETIALKKTFREFQKKYDLKIDSKIIKEATLAELGTAQQVGAYLANVVKFTLNKISPENRAKSINSVKRKIYNFNENELANKKMPASAASGSAITFLKHVLFKHEAGYIRAVINEIVRNL